MILGFQMVKFVNLCACRYKDENSREDPSEV